MLNVPPYPQQRSAPFISAKESPTALRRTSRPSPPLPRVPERWHGSWYPVRPAFSPPGGSGRRETTPVSRRRTPAARRRADSGHLFPRQAEPLEGGPPHLGEDIVEYESDKQDHLAADRLSGSEGTEETRSRQRRGGAALPSAPP